MDHDTNPHYPKRPPRIQLFQHVRPFYFITFNTAKRAALLNNSELHAAFIKFCGRAHTEHSVSVGRYVIMPDHIHLFVSMPEHELTLQRWMQALKSVLGKTLLKQGNPKPHWQTGFFDHVLGNADSYGEKWQYVQLNPLRAKLSSTIEEWPHQGEIVRLSF